MTLATLLLAGLGCKTLSETPTPPPTPAAPTRRIEPQPPPAPVKLPGAPVEGVRYWATAGTIEDFLAAREAPRPSKTVEVSNVRELLAALGSDTLIRLAPGRYTFDDADPLENREDEADYSGLSPHYQDGVIRGVRNLVLAAATDQPTVILQPDSYAPVLHFEAVEDLGLHGLTLGHRPDLGFCRGDVLRTVHSQRVEVSHTTLFGSGTKGVTVLDVDGFRLADSVITDCTEGFADIGRSQGVRLERVVVAGNNADLLRGFTISKSELVFDQVEMQDNHALVNSADPSMDYGRLFSVGLDSLEFYDVTGPFLVPVRKRTSLTLIDVNVDGAKAVWPPREGSGHCTPDEMVRFSCPVTKGKTASICQTESDWEYRFGRLDTVELSLPMGKATQPATHQSVVTGDDALKYQAVFSSDGHSYTVEVNRTEDVLEGQIVVRKEGRTISTVLCRGDVEGDFTHW